MNKSFYISCVDYKEVLKRIWERRKLFFTIVPMVMVLSSLFILCIPRTYTCNIKLAPEYDLGSVNSMRSLASQFGLNFGSGPNADAISPDLYPYLMGSTDFVVDLFSINVRTLDGAIDTDYYTYLKEYNKYPWWSALVRSIKTWGSNIIKDDSQDSKNPEADPFKLTKTQTEIVKIIKKRIQCVVLPKNGVISFTVQDQDPLVCATLATAVSGRLQDFITDYRTSKARKDVDYYSELVSQLEREYEQASQSYGDFVDSHASVNLRSMQAKIDNLENEMQIKYNIYSSALSHLYDAKAKVQDNTPAFTTLQSATVPVRPSAPKRILFVLVVSFIATIGTLLYVLQDILKS